MKKIALILVAFVMAQTAMAQQFSLPIMPQKMWPSDYAKYEKDVLNCCEWLLNASPEFNQPKHDECTSFMVRWLTGTPEVSVMIDARLVDVGKEALLTSFMAAWTRHALNNKDDDRLLCATVAVEETLAFYVTHKKAIGKSKLMEKLLKEQANGNLALYVNQVING